MKLPTIAVDRWRLRSGEASHGASPDKFWIPPREDRQNLRVGQAAKLIFEISTFNEDGSTATSGERMWVIVSERVGDGYIGILDNEPVSVDEAELSYLCRGAEVPFLPEHVIDIADPPCDYAQQRLSEQPSRVWSRS
jgi:hypothetical protein